MVNLACLQTTVAHSRLLYENSFNSNQTIYDSVHNLVYFQCFVCFLVFAACVSTKYGNALFVSKTFSDTSEQFLATLHKYDNRHGSIRHVICVHISTTKKKKTSISEVALPYQQLKMGINNHTIVSDNFTGMLNRYDMSDTSRANTSRLIRHVFVFGEHGMNNLLRRCYLVHKTSRMCHVC